MKVVITAAARADLAEIQAFIAQDNPARADSFADELVARCEELTDAPRAYPLLPRYKRIGFPRRAYKSYLIFYIARGDGVDVARVIHGARDYDRLLGIDDDPPS